MKTTNALAIVLLAACTNELAVPAGAEITCSRNADCPPDFRCVESTGLCVSRKANSPPRLALGAVTRSLAEVQVPFVVSDAEGDSVDVVAEYTWQDPADPGAVWLPASPAVASAPLVGIRELGSEHRFVWAALDDAQQSSADGLVARDAAIELAGGDTGSTSLLVYTAVTVRLTPRDRAGTGAAVLSPRFFVGNDPPVATLTALPNEARGNVVFGVTISDTTSDPADLEVEFRAGASEPWRRAKLALGTRSSLTTSPVGEPHIFVWDSAAPTADDPTVEQGIGQTRGEAVQVRAFASDAPFDATSFIGPADEVTLDASVMNQTPVRVLDIETPQLKFVGGVGPVPVYFVLADDESDPADVVVEVSYDYGLNWSPAREFRRAESGGLLGLRTSPQRDDGSGGARHLFVWDPVGTAVTPQLTTRLRITASDGRNGAAVGVAEMQLERAVAPTGTAVFQQPLAQTMDWAPSANADLNADGHEDLLFLGNTIGAMFWSAPGQYVFDNPNVDPINMSPNYLALGDFNGDALPDVVTAPYSIDGSFTVLSNTTTGNALSFTAQRIVLPDPDGSANLMGVYGAVVGHFNADAHLDIVVGVGVGCAPSCPEQPGLYMYAGDGAGNFQSPVITAATRRMSPRAVDDVNGDGLDDVLEIQDDSNAQLVHVFASAGGTFTDQWALDAEDSLNTGRVYVADLDGDGRRDLVRNANDEATLYFYRGQAPVGGAPPYVFSHSRQLDSQPTDLTLRDINGDGIVDIATTAGRSGSNAVSSYASRLNILFGNQRLGRPDGTFGPLVSLAMGAPRFTFLSSLDLEEDGVRELYLYSYSSDTISRVSLRDYAPLGPGALSEGTPFETLQSFESHAADLDADGITDLVMARSGLLAVYRARGSMGFGEDAFTPELFDMGARADQLELGDVNGDGVLDLVTLSYGPDYSYGVALGEHVDGVGTGRFGAFAFTPIGSSATFVNLADMNGDGVLDLVFTENTARLYYGDHVAGVPTGTFTAGPTIDLGYYTANTVLAEDLDADGVRDIIGAVNDSSSRYGLAAACSNGAGVLSTATSFFPQYLSAVVWSIKLLGVRDLDDDGLPDVAFSAVGNAGADLVGYVHGNGACSFGAVSWLVISDQPTYGFALADLNGDAIPELLTSSRAYDWVDVSMFLSSGGVSTGTLVGAFDQPVGHGSETMLVTDLNMDGLPDVVLRRDSVNQSRVLHTQANRFAGRAWQPLTGAGAWRTARAFGEGVVPTGVDKLGNAWDAGYVTMSEGTATSRGEIADPIAELRAAFGLTGAMRLLAAPKRFAGDVYLARAESPSEVWGAHRWQVRRRFGPTLDPTRGAPNGAGLSLSGAIEGQRGVIVVLPQLAGRSGVVAGNVRAFYKPHRLLRAAELESAADASDEVLPMARRADGSVYDVLVETGGWVQIPAGSFTSGTGPRFRYLTDAPGPRVEVLTDELGLFVAVVRP